MYLDSYKNCFSEFSNVKILLYYNVYTLYFTKFDSFTALNTSSVTLELSVIHDRTCINTVSKVYRTFTDTLRKVKIDSLP